jgi:competence protein ComEA
VFDAPAEPASQEVATGATPGAVAARVGGSFASPPILIGIGLALAGLAIAIAILLAATGAAGGVALDPGAGRPLDSGTPAIAGGGGEIVVDVAGAVLRPGVYHLPTGSRIGDAIAAAGGYSPRVAVDLTGRSLNLAALVHDGDQVIVPSRDDVATAPPGGGAGSGGSGGSGSGGSLVDLNHASADELDALPGIGPVTAQKIIASRAQTPFTSVDQLLERKIVGQKTFDQLRPLVTVG